MSEPNQKIVTIHKKTYNRDFIVLGNEDWERVANIEGNSKAPLILYLYLLENKDSFELELSPQKLVNQFGSSRRTWERAIQVLIAERYLVAAGNGNKYYDFYQSPQEIKEVNLECNFKEFLALDEGGQEQRYNRVIDKEWEDMNDDDRLIHDYYVKYVIEGE